MLTHLCNTFILHPTAAYPGADDRCCLPSGCKQQIYSICPLIQFVTGQFTLPLHAVSRHRCDLAGGRETRTPAAAAHNPVHSSCKYAYQIHGNGNRVTESTARYFGVCRIQRHIGAYSRCAIISAYAVNLSPISGITESTVKPGATPRTAQRDVGLFVNKRITTLAA